MRPTISDPSGQRAAAVELRAEKAVRHQHRFRRGQIGFILAVVPALFVAAIVGIAVGSTHVESHVILRVIGARVFPFWIQTPDVSRADEVI